MLDLIWFAKFKDTSIIQQFDDIEKQEKEHPFKEVLDRHDKLEHFALLNVHNNFLYTVNLKNGTIGISLEGSNFLEPSEDLLKDNSYRYRLIYFRRISRTFGLDLIQVGNTSIVYYLGYQYNLANGSNIKRLIQIDKYGKVVIN